MADKLVEETKKFISDVLERNGGDSSVLAFYFSTPADETSRKFYRSLDFAKPAGALAFLYDGRGCVESALMMGGPFRSCDIQNMMRIARTMGFSVNSWGFGPTAERELDAAKAAVGVE